MSVNPVANPMQLEILGELAEIHGAAAPGVESSKSAGFADTLKRTLSEANSLLNQSDKKIVEMASGKSENLHDAMITFEKAETAFKLLVQARNKAIEAYHEIMRMQV